MNLRRIVHISLSALLLSGAIALVGFARMERDDARFEQLEIFVQEVDGMYLVDGESVRQAIVAEDSIVGSYYADVSLSAVEGWVREAIPAVGNVQVYPGLNGVLQVDVTQRRPVARWHREGGEPDLYMDDLGETMPLSGAFTARVPLIFAQNEAEAELGFSYLSALTEDDLWRAFTDGLVIQNEQVELIPRLGSARIELGEIDELPRQMHYLDAFYREQIARGNLNDYKKISLQYEGQIVAQRHY